MRDAFRQFARIAADAVGSPGAFLLGVGATLVWAATGPYFHYSDTWQLIINTGTTIVTFLMVFLIQNTQNRDMAVLHLKLDELIRVNEAARNKLLDLEGLTEKELEQIKGRFTRLAGSASDQARLHDAADDLETAAEDIGEMRAALAHSA